jgi:hypothetical protein
LWNRIGDESERKSILLADKEFEVCFIGSNLADVLKSNIIRPNSDETPMAEGDNTHHVEQKNSLRVKTVFSPHKPHNQHSRPLNLECEDCEVAQGDNIVLYDGILECANNCSFKKQRMAKMFQ